MRREQEITSSKRVLEFDAPKVLRRVRLVLPPALHDEAEGWELAWAKR